MSAFPFWSQLSEEIMVSILSFIADVPFEVPDERTSCWRAPSALSTLTHVLPFVSKQIHRLVGNDLFWKDALERLLKREPFLWKEGLSKLLVMCGGVRTKDVSVDKAFSALRKANRGTIHKHIFQYVLKNHLRYTSSVFYMPHRVQLDQSFGLHFFEPRYRLLIAETMSRWPGSARRGAPIHMLEHEWPDPPSFPNFIYGNHRPLAPNSPACIVRVEQCVIHPDSTADVMLSPEAHVWIEAIRERPGTRGLAEATVIRMPRVYSERLELTMMPSPYDY